MKKCHMMKASRSSFSGIRRIVAIMVASVFLATAAPAPAQASCYNNYYESFFFCFDLGKLAAWIAQAAIWAAEQAAQAAMYLEKELGAQIRAVAPLVAQQLESNINIAAKQGALDAKRRALQAVESGNAAQNSLLTTQAQSCAMAHAGQESSVAAAITAQAVGKLSDLSASRGAGAKADTTAESFIAAQLQERCQLGFIDNSGNGPYGDIPIKLKCVNPPAPKYIDADGRLSSVLTPLQYPLPQNSHVNPDTPDGHMSFIGTGGTAQATEAVPGLGSELDFAAAYRFCEQLQPNLATPSKNTGEPEVSDVVSIRADRNDVASRTLAASECFRALAYRTSCPSNSTSALQGPGGADCHEAQVQICARLKATHKQGGLELKMEGSDPLYATALKNCDTEGLSQAMYDAIMAHRCHDTNFMTRVLPMMLGSSEAAERARVTDCAAQEAMYEKYMQQEQRRVNKAIGILMQISGSGGSSAGTKKAK